MKKVLKLVCVLLSLFMLTALIAGCGSTTNTPSQSTDDNPTKQPNDSTNDPNDGTIEPITITVRNVYPGKDWELKDTPVGAVFYEKTGVNVKMEHSVGDEMQTIALLLASGDLPDIVAPHYQVGPFIEAGEALELTDLIEQYAPNYKKALGDLWGRMAWNKEDQGRYSLIPPAYVSEPFEQRNWFFLQHAVVIDQNYPEMKTLQHYEDAIRSYMEKYPTIDGQPTIGLTLLADDWRWIISLTNPAMMAAGTQSSGEFYVDPETKEITYRVLREEEKEYFRWLNHMYNDGLLDREAFTQTLDQYQAKIATGRVLGITDMGWQFADAEKALRQDGKSERTYGSYPVVLEEGIINTAFCGDNALLSPTPIMIISKNTQYPERIMQFVDYLVSEEGQILNYWGIEGVHYDIIGGKRVFKEEEMSQRYSDPDYSLKTGIGLLSAFPSYGEGVKDSSGQYYTLSSKEDVIKQYSDTDRQVLTAYGKETWADFFAKPAEFIERQWPKEGSIVNMLPADSDGSVAFQKLQDVVKKDVIRAIVSKPSEFDNIWEEFEANMEKAGHQTFVNAIKELIVEQMDLWGMDFYQ